MGGGHVEDVAGGVAAGRDACRGVWRPRGVQRPNRVVRPLATAVIIKATGWERSGVVWSPLKVRPWKGGFRGPKKGSNPFSTSGNGDFSVNFLHVFRAQN